MRHVKKLFVLLIAVAVACLTYFVYLGGIDEVTGDKKTLTIHYHDQSTLTLNDNFKESLFDVINQMIKS